MSERARRGTAIAPSLLTVAAGILLVAIGVAALVGDVAEVRLSWLLPLAGLAFHPDALAGLFTVVTGAVAIPVAVYLAGYARRTEMPVFASWLVPVFVLSTGAVSLAGSVTTFLFCWELMALTSIALVLAEHHREETRRAGVYYAVLTELGFLAVLVGLVVLSALSGSDVFSGMRTGAVSTLARNLIFVLTLVGFGSKAGLVPLHAWLPRAHPEAPSPVSALMSAAMVNLGIYGLIRFDLQILGPGPEWWGVVLIVIGIVSAVFGALRASTESDLKRLLAHSTTENMGLIALALGSATLLSATGSHVLAAVAMSAALVHLVSHAAFKSLAFLASGSVVAGAGLRDLDAMGGLVHRMPMTTGLFGLAALGACGLPLGAGFIGEWLLLQVIVHAPRHADPVQTIALPVACGALALTTGLAVAAMVKAFGIGFLARARSEEAAAAREAAPGMIAGMGVAAMACIVLAVAPSVLARGLTRVLAVLPAAGGAQPPDLGLELRLPGAVGAFSPVVLVVALTLALVVMLLLGAWQTRRRPAPASRPLWACGADELSPRMQYTATSFAEPLERVFDNVLRPQKDVDVSHASESRYLVDQVVYRRQQSDPFETGLYRPVLRMVSAVGAGFRRIHSGNLHGYLTIGSGGLGLLLIVVLVVGR